MTKEEYRELIIDAVKTLKIDYEDFIEKLLNENFI